MTTNPKALARGIVEEHGVPSLPLEQDIADAFRDVYQMAMEDAARIAEEHDAQDIADAIRAHAASEDET